MGRAALSLLVLVVLSAAAKSAVPARPVSRGIVIANWAPREIRELYLSPASSQDWGVDRLEGRVIPMSDDVKLSYGGACRADLRVVFDNGGAEERHDIDVCHGRYLGIRPGWTTADDVAGLTPPALVPVRNRSGRTMARLYLFPDGAAEEGADRLGHDVLLDGDVIDVLRPLAATCDFSLRAVFEDDGAEERYGGIDLCHYRGIMVEGRPSLH
jgi:hypothetical protein